MTRHIALEGVDNFRDFGGYATACGRGLKPGRLFRSANHARATDADLQALSDLGLSVIVDLRRSQERERDPSRRWEPFVAAVIENDIEAEHLDWTELLRSSDLTARWFFEDSLSFYRKAPSEARHIDLFRRYFQALETAEGAVLVHCAAGKDRTGLLCALTHHIAGVHPDDTLADYLLTNDPAHIERRAVFATRWIEEHVGKTIGDEAVRTALSVDPAYLKAAFAAIDETYGSTDRYLEEILGVDGGRRERIRERVLG
jgi:protein tyrosine/serine phosphatase